MRHSNSSKPASGSRLRAAALSVALAALLYLVLAAGTDPQRVLDAAARVEPVWWLPVLALSLLNYGLRFGRWHYYLSHLGDRVPLGHDLAIYLAGFSLTTTPGKAGEAVRSVYLARLGVDYGHSLAAFFGERFLDLLAIALLATLVLVDFPGYAAWAAAPLALCALVLLLVQRPGLAARMLPRRLRRGTPPRPLQKLLHAWHAAAMLFRPRPLYLGLALGAIAWTAEGIGLLLVSLALGEPLTPAQAVGIYAASMLIGALSFIPGGLGSTEAAMGVLLTLAGMPPAVAVAATVIVRLATLWFAVALGLAALPLAGLARASHTTGIYPALRTPREGGES